MRQGKLSELIHNSGSSAPAEGEVVEPAADVEGAEYDEESEEEDWDAAGKKKKGKGKGKKGKKGPAVDESHLIQSCTVEVWFREIIDLVSPSFSN